MSDTDKEEFKLNESELKVIKHAVLGLEIDGKLTEGAVDLVMSRLCLPSEVIKKEKAQRALSARMTYGQVAEYLDVSKSTARNLRREGLITPIRRSHTHVRFDRDEVISVYNNREKASIALELKLNKQQKP